MKKNEREYLAPEVEVMEVMLEQVIAISGNIEESGENEEVGWVI